MALPNEYESYATVLVEPQSISKKLVESGKRRADVINRLHLMTMQILSRARLSKVIDELKLYPKESEKKTREQVIDMMRNRIQVEPVLPDLDPELKKSLITPGQHLPALLPPRQMRAWAPRSRIASRTTSSTNTSRSACSPPATPPTSSRASCSASPGGCASSRRRSRRSRARTPGASPTTSSPTSARWRAASQHSRWRSSGSPRRRATRPSTRSRRPWRASPGSATAALAVQAGALAE